jgi:hypothetical protein
MCAKRSPLALLFLACFIGPPPRAGAASCTTQAQMTEAQRQALVNTSRALMSQVQSGNVEGLRANTLPAVAANFGGIQQSVQYLAPLVQRAAITVDNLYYLDASTDPPRESQIDFYCGSPVVGFNFNGLPPGKYAVAILHATGVPQPQEVSLILSQTQDNQWQLAGFFDKPMILGGHDGVWYWRAARQYAQSRGDWAAWFYYRIASYLLNPVDFMASSNLEKLRQEANQLHPQLPGASSPLTVSAAGATFQVTSIDTTTVFGPLDLEVHYSPDPSQVAELRYPVIARKQVTELMAALLAAHPDLQNAFHGMWLHADQGNASVFALELPMKGAISPSAAPGAAPPAGQ